MQKTVIISYMPETENILVRGVNWIGDAVMSAPAIRVIGQTYPEGGVTLLVNRAVAGLFEKDPHVGSIFEYGDEFRTIAGRFRLAKRLKDRGFTTAVLLQNAFDAAFIAWLSRIEKRIGYKRDARGMLLTNGVAVTSETLRLHHTRYYLDMLSSAGFDAPYRLPWLYLDTAERRGALESLSNLKRPVTGINPGAAFGSAKRWPPERFASLITRIITERGGSAVLFGSRKDIEISTAIRGHLKPDITTATERFIDLTGRTDIRGLCATIAGCDLLITNDSGPMHIAYATGTPVIAVFGSTAPELTGPPMPPPETETTEMPEFSFRHRIIRKKTPCAPCFKRICPQGHLKCMLDISVTDVFDEIDSIVGRKRAVFFDRDGTLCEDAHYLNSFADFRPYDGLDRLSTLKDKGYMLIGISNQSGIGRGLVNEGFVKELHRLIMEKYGFDDFYHCRHVPADNCACRKPSPGMLLRARARYGIDIKNSIFVGDKNVDMETAISVGAKPVFFRTKRHSLTVSHKEEIRQVGSLDELLGVIE